MDQKKRLLLHSCCGPCSSACIERLAAEYDITVFYFNPCITDEAEYERRKENQIRLIEGMNQDRPEEAGEIRYVEGAYDPDEYLRLVKGLEREPEGGARCAVCFRQRLRGAAEYANANGFGLFTTTLTVSPHKSFPVITKIGEEEAARAGVSYLPVDFKKKDGFRRSVELSKQYGLYRQNYCGCEFSRRG